jgi:hypothetical protein
MSHSGLSSGGKLQIVPVTFGDAEELRGALRIVKEKATRKNDKATARSIIMKLDRLEKTYPSWKEEKEGYPQQVLLKPSEVEMVRGLRNAFKMKLDYTVC